ncbi:PRTRC system protein C [Dechloromonas agitata]|uniref:PRTRC system protein C n=1 Tax=Dechloromonas agitata TaxID=73030 RepID=UPI00237E5A8E|nr:PRTRC system protein C [Dechloromonas agitata]MDE1544113.1 PRTRC system protein C [Dechloromonas agitata]
MTIAINEIRRVFRYNGVQLPDVPGMEARDVRDLYSAQYPELISAEVEAGEVVDGVQEYTFRKAVGTKGGGGLAALKAAVAVEAEGRTDAAGKLAQALTRRGTQERGGAWGAFVLRTRRDANERHAARILLTSDMLAPLP